MRPSLARLWSWRYDGLRDLPLVTTAAKFATANAGFLYETQLIDVGDYRGIGESAPVAHFIQVGVVRFSE